MLRVGFRRVKTFRTVNTENVMLLSSLLVIEAKCRVFSLSIVYTEAKYLLKTCAMEKGSAVHHYSREYNCVCYLHIYIKMFNRLNLFGRFLNRCAHLLLLD